MTISLIDLKAQAQTLSIIFWVLGVLSILILTMTASAYMKLQDNHVYVCYVLAILLSLSLSVTARFIGSNIASFVLSIPCFLIFAFITIKILWFIFR